MARRNLFQPPAPPSDKADAAIDPASPDPKPRFPNTGAMSGVKSTLRDLSSNAVREIATDTIEEDGPKDRLGQTDADVAPLVDSIRAHGQQVPIMVRPIAAHPGRYRIVYGRRRLRALRLLGLPAKALVRSLSDTEAVLAQGQENSQRLNPSFIEKALFVAELAKDGYEQPVILDALAIDKPMLSRMSKVAKAIPLPVIQQVGSAHGIGRRRWEELADHLRESDVDAVQIAQQLGLAEVPSSDDRFARLSNAIMAHGKTAPVLQPLPAQMIRLGEGVARAELKETARALTVKLSKTEMPEFTTWVRDNAEAELTRLYQAWKAAQPTK